jgi:hypothetical protein
MKWKILLCGKAPKERPCRIARSVQKGISDLRSAKEGLPIYRVDGGPGFIWGQASTTKGVGFSDWPRWMYLDFFPRHQRNNQHRKRSTGNRHP